VSDDSRGLFARTTAAMSSDDMPRLRQPEYTGENRCTPCTVVNVLIAGTLGLGLAAVVRPALGAAAVAAGAGVIYLRGYLVPGTPALTERYFPPWLLRAFGKEPLERQRTAMDRDGEAATGEDKSERALVASGVVGSGGSGGFDLTGAFREAWRERMASASGVEPADVAGVFGADSARRLGDGAFDLDGSASLRWGSEAAVLADVTAASLLAERSEAWAGWDRDTRRSVLMGLRLCLSACPACGGAVRVEEDRVDPCCQKPHLTAEAVCADCGAVLADTAVVDSGESTTVRATLFEP
jgi:hypothetical protein